MNARLAERALQEYSILGIIEALNIDEQQLVEAALLHGLINEEELEAILEEEEPYSSDAEGD